MIGQLSNCLFVCQRCQFAKVGPLVLAHYGLKQLRFFEHDVGVGAQYLIKLLFLPIVYDESRNCGLLTRRVDVFPLDFVSLDLGGVGCLLEVGV